jgi:16S rRNA processing protein RimM
MKSLESEHLEQPAGSPDKGEPVFLVIGKLRRPHGVRGEIIMDVLTDFPERLKKGVSVFVGQDHRVETIRSLRQHGSALLVAFQGYDVPETVGVMRNELVYVRADDRPPLAEGEYYHHELIGLRVVDESGDLLGTLTQILDTRANDVYVVRPQDGPEILLPAIESVILDINLEKGEIRVHLLPGLIVG